MTQEKYSDAPLELREIIEKLKQLDNPSVSRQKVWLQYQGVHTIVGMCTTHSFTFDKGLTYTRDCVIIVTCLQTHTLILMLVGV